MIPLFTVITYNKNIDHLKTNVGNRKEIPFVFVLVQMHYSPINREFYLAKGTEKFILGFYLLSGILLILLS
jgi:hypothetical protein